MTVANARGWRWFFQTVGRRVFLGVGLLVLALLTAAGLIAGSVWVEYRFPSDDARRALLPRAQRAVTKPVVEALGRQLDRALQRQAEAQYLEDGLTLDETIPRFLDERVDFAERRYYAYRLAKVGSPECVAALRKVFASVSAPQQAFLAQFIGSTGNPALKTWLLSLLDDNDERVVGGAIRGLCSIGGADVAARVAGILTDDSRAESLRVEAAQGLGTIGTPAACDALAAAFAAVPEEEVATEILNSLGKFPFAQTAESFRQYLANDEIPAAMRVVAVEALANSSPEAVPFLLGLAGRDAAADVRAAAAWVISTKDTVTDLAPSLVNLAAQESDADVRRRLYEALLPQAGIPADRLLPLVRTEDDIEARVAGFNAIGRAAAQSPATPVTAEFDQQIVPELVTIATADNSLNVQMRAVFALRRAETAAAQAALAVIAHQARPPIAAAARSGLRTPNP